MEYMSQKELHHGMMKPAFIKLHPEGTVRVMGYGIGTYVDDPVIDAYTAPEVKEG